MTKGGSTKSKTLGRLIFGEKRKQHASPSRHRSSARNATKSGDKAEPAEASAPPPAIPPRTARKPLNLHDWSLWRIQLNEQLASILTERRSDLRTLRQFLQSSSFYQKENHEENNGRLLFSIPRAKFHPEDVENLPPEPPEPVTYEPTQSDEHSTIVVQPKILPVSSFDGMRTTRSFAASDRIHATLQKAVKDGNVLEKIKAFEMQAAAAASSRMNSVTSSIRTFSPTKKVPNLIEAAHGDVILRSQRVQPEDEEFSITAISSMPLQRTRQRRTTTPRRRWLKSGEKQEILIVKKKKKTNRRVHDENLKTDDEVPEQTNTYENEGVVQRRPTEKHRQKLSSTDADDRLTRTIDRQGDQSELDDEPSDGNVFIEDSSFISRAQRQSLKKTIHLTRKSRDDAVHTPVNDVPNFSTMKKKQRACMTNPPTKQMSKQILQAIMNSMNPNHQQHQEAPNAEFFDNGPLSNPEDSLVSPKD